MILVPEHTLSPNFHPWRHFRFAWNAVPSPNSQLFFLLDFRRMSSSLNLYDHSALLENVALPQNPIPTFLTQFYTWLIDSFPIWFSSKPKFVDVADHISLTFACKDLLQYLAYSKSSSYIFSGNYCFSPHELGQVTQTFFGSFICFGKCD